jgi:hypothetical protein
LLATIVVSSTYAFSIFDWAFVSGTGPYWQHLQRWDLDRAQALIGFRYFARDAWRFPVFHVPALRYPEGTTIVFTDSIPLLAAFFKVLFEITGWEVNYLGAWMALCYVLQGVTAALLLDTLGVRGWVPVLSGVVVALAAPPLVGRFSHGALTGQFFVLYALREYYVLVERPRNALRWVGLVVALAATTVVTAYLTAMVGAIAMATLLESVRRRKLTAGLAATILAAAISCVVGAIYVAGLIGPSAPSSATGGFGHYSMNLLAPFFGDQDSFTQRIFGPVTTDATGGQYEGFAYLGAGVLGLGAAACAFWTRDVVAALRRHGVLAAILTGLSFYAVSNVAFVGGSEVYRFSVPTVATGVTDSFRSSGRFFWPAYYALTLGLIAFTLRRVPRHAGTAIAIAVAMLQLTETRGLRSSVAAAARRVNEPYFVDAMIAERVRAADRLFFYPSFECTEDDATWPQRASWRGITLEVMLLASQRAVPSNSMYVNRRQKDCDRERTAFPPSVLEPGTLYIVRVESTGPWIDDLKASGTCVLKEPALVCGARADAGATPTAGSSRPAVVGPVARRADRTARHPECG